MVRTMTVGATLALVGLALGLGACSSNDDESASQPEDRVTAADEWGDLPPPPFSTNSYELQANARVLDQGLCDVVTVLDDELEIPDDAPGLEDVGQSTEGDTVIVCKPSSLTENRARNPLGFMRRIVSKRFVGPKLVVKTETVGLGEVFSKLQVAMVVKAYPKPESRLQISGLSRPGGLPLAQAPDASAPSCEGACKVAVDQGFDRAVEISSQDHPAYRCIQRETRERMRGLDGSCYTCRPGGMFNGWDPTPGQCEADTLALGFQWDLNLSSAGRVIDQPRSSPNFDLLVQQDAGVSVGATFRIWINMFSEGLFRPAKLHNLMVSLEGNLDVFADGQLSISNKDTIRDWQRKPPIDADTEQEIEGPQYPFVIAGTPVVVTLQPYVGVRLRATAKGEFEVDYRVSRGISQTSGLFYDNGESDSACGEDPGRCEFQQGGGEWVNDNWYKIGSHSDSGAVWERNLTAVGRAEADASVTLSAGFSTLVYDVVGPDFAFSSRLGALAGIEAGGSTGGTDELGGPNPAYCFVNNYWEIYGDFGASWSLRLEEPLFGTTITEIGPYNVFPPERVRATLFSGTFPNWATPITNGLLGLSGVECLECVPTALGSGTADCSADVHCCSGVCTDGQCGCADAGGTCQVNADCCGTLYCDETTNTCAERCPGECTPEASECDDNGDVITCDQRIDGCWAHGDPEPCDAGQVCGGGECQDCNECDTDSYGCVNDYVGWRCVDDGNGCRVRESLGCKVPGCYQDVDRCHGIEPDDPPPVCVDGCSEGQVGCFAPSTGWVCEPGSLGCLEKKPVSCQTGNACYTDPQECAYGGGCMDQCSEGDTGCLSDAQGFVCERAPNGCLEQRPVTCQTAAACSSNPGACLGGCSNQCAPGEVGCFSNSLGYTCQQDAGGCWVKTPTACRTGLACYQNARTCVDGCTDDCAIGEVGCFPGNDRDGWTCQKGPDGCNDRVAVACKTSTSCSSSPSICVNGCPATSCEADATGCFAPTIGWECQRGSNGCRERVQVDCPAVNCYTSVNACLGRCTHECEPFERGCYTPTLGWKCEKGTDGCYDKVQKSCASSLACFVDPSACVP